ncbi:glycosyltransferase [Cryobacterium sp. MLB-32]|uniref:glycosyltransferase n=1 Tax=Cryobacterium sp. MLB-32 TaxID=1529318 RepID=UPI000691AD5E|nr:glycosyltransferase [Cryobacterium sp. MLB-32]
MQSFPEGRDTTNPYLVQLMQGLQPHVRVTGLSWRRALTERVDVFHVHWPELLLRAGTPGRRMLRRTLVRMLLVKWRLQRTAIVRTLHNTHSHEALPRADRRLLSRLDDQTSLFIRLNPTTEAPFRTATGLPSGTMPLVHTIMHGDYRPWFRDAQVPPRVTGRLLNFGLIRPYKGIPALVAAFAACPDDSRSDTPGLSLHIVGRPGTDSLRSEITRAATLDPRIVLALGHATDHDLVEEIGQAELVVLPYREMHNSGAALLALSLNRPVLVPSNDVTEELGREVGPGWVITYHGPISPRLLAAAIERSRAIHPASSPDLSDRSWDLIVTQHLAAYQAAIVSRARSRPCP